MLKSCLIRCSRSVKPQAQIKNGSLRLKHTSAAEKFPYSNVSEKQMKEWTEELQELELPLRAFFARHRPLMVMEKHQKDTVSASSANSKLPRYVHVWSPSSSLLEGGQNSVVSFNIAQQLGAFDTRKVDHSSDIGTRVAKNNNNGMSVMNPDDSTTLIMTRSRSGESALEAVISFLNDKVEFVSEDKNDESEIQATSVKRKRKLKMNRHKYRKRLKAQRALRKRLGK